MIHRQVSKEDPAADAAVAPAYRQRLDLEPIPIYRMPDHGAAPEAVFPSIHARCATAEAILRVPIREGSSYDLAGGLSNALRSASNLSGRQPAADLNRIKRLQSRIAPRRAR